MRCLLVDGSGHAGGHTDAMCSAAVSFLESKGWEADVVRLPTDGTMLHAYDGCPPIEDDFLAPVLRDIGSYDLMILASPIFFSGPSSMMKTFIDRMNPFWNSGKPYPKKVCAMLCGGAEEPKFSNAESEMKAMAKGCGAEWAGILEICGTDSKDSAESSSKVPEFLEYVIQAF